MGYIASIICALITFGMALLQLMITLGAPLGEFVLGGQYKVLPKKMRITSCIFTCLFTFLGLVYLHYGNVINISLNHTFAKVIIIFQTLFLGYAIYGNGFLTKSKKEKYVMTPISIVTFLCSIAVLFLV